MKKSILYSLILMVILFFSCNNNAQNNMSNDDIIGEWNWVSTNGGFAFNVHETPSTTEEIIVLKISKNYSYLILENDTIVSEGTYSLVLKKSIYDGNMKSYLTLSDNYSNQNVIIGGLINNVSKTELNIVDNMHDGIGSWFKRIK